MESEHSKPRIMTSDRLSMLPDHLIHKILSFTSIRNAVQASALSSRWRFIWTSMPYLNISTTTDRLPHLSEFVNHVLSHRNDQTDVYSLNLRLCQWTYSDTLLKTILDYAFSHNVQQLTLSTTYTPSYDKKIEFPPSLFRSPSLKYLSLTGSSHRFFHNYSITLASTWDLPALTTLHLDYVGFHEDDGTGIGIFSKCAKLESLTLINFKILESRNPTLCHPKLANITLKDGHWTARRLNVVAPQLKSLTIRRCRGKHVIAAPNLESLLFHSECRLKFSTDLPSLEKVDLCICCSRDVWTPYRIARLLHQLLSVKFLKLNLEFLEPLISCLGKISPQPSPFSNLKSLKVYPVYVTLDDKPHVKIILSTQVINFLLDGSPGATFTLISYEEIKEKMQKARALANAAEAQKLMTDLQVLLEKEKDNIETNMNHPVEADAHDQGKSPVEKVKLQFERKMEQMKSYWKDVGIQIDRGGRTCDIISWLHDIEVLLLKDLPTSKRDELQSCFSSLCAEVDSVVKKILHRMNIPQIHLNDCFNELATTSISPS